MSEIVAEDYRSKLKEALLVGNLHEAQKILREAKTSEAITPVEYARIQRVIEQANFGKTTPMQNPELYALAAKL